MRKKTILVVLAGALLWGGLGSANAVVNCEMHGWRYLVPRSRLPHDQIRMHRSLTACHGI